MPLIAPIDATGGRRIGRPPVLLSVWLSVSSRCEGLRGGIGLPAMAVRAGAFRVAGPRMSPRGGRPIVDRQPPTTGRGGPPAPSHAVEWRAAVPLAGCRFYSTRARPRVRLDQAMSNQWPANVAGASMRPPSSPWDRYHVDFVLVNPYRSGESRRACR
nr:hypothetical protein DO63_5883 [Burkholderia pseudomallei]